MILKWGAGGYSDFSGYVAPEVTIFCGTKWPVWFYPGMFEGIAWFKLLVILIGDETKVKL
jgi:hypothetical protein